MARSFLLPYRLTPNLVPLTAVEAGREDVSFEILLAASERMKASGQKIAAELDGMRQRHDPPFTMKMLYYSTGDRRTNVKKGTLFSIQTTCGTLLDAATQRSNILTERGPPSADHSTVVVEVGSSSQGKMDSQGSSSWLLFWIPAQGEASFLRRVRPHLEVLREFGDLLLDLPFCILALVVFATGWRSIELVRQMRRQTTFVGVRVAIMWQTVFVLYDLPFVLAFPLVALTSWGALLLANPVLSGVIFSRFTPELLFKPAVPLWACSVIIATLLWRVVPLTCDMIAGKDAVQRRSAVARQLVLLALDPIAIGAGVVSICGIYRMPTLWLRLSRGGGEAAIRTCRLMDDGMPQVRGWAEVTASHRMLVGAAISQLVDLPFVIMALIVTLSGYRTRSLWRTLAADWPLSAHQKEELLAASPFARALMRAPQQQRRMLIERSRTTSAATGGSRAAEQLPVDCLMLIVSHVSSFRSLCHLECICSAWRTAITVHHQNQTRGQWASLLQEAWLLHTKGIDQEALLHILRLAGANQRNTAVDNAIAKASFNPKRAFADLYVRQAKVRRWESRRRAAAAPCVASRTWLSSTRRGAVLKEFSGLIRDLPFLVLAMPILLSVWRLPAALTQAKHPSSTDYCRLRFIFLSHALLSVIDLPLLMLGSVLHLAHMALGHRLQHAMDPDFEASLARVHPEPSSFLARTPLLALTLSGGRPHLWVLRQLCAVLLHTFHLALGAVLCISWRRTPFLRMVEEAESRQQLRQLVVNQALWLAADLLCLPLLLIVVITAWRLPTLLSLMRQKSFRAGRDVSASFSSAAFTTFSLLVSDIWCAILLVFVVLTCMRAPHALSALASLSRAYRRLWRSVRLQTDDALHAQLTQLIHEQESLAALMHDPGRIDDLCAYAMAGVCVCVCVCVRVCVCVCVCVCV
jgi:hypothetical protein